MIRILRAINRFWAASWEISAWGLLARAWDALVDRFVAPRHRS